MRVTGFDGRVRTWNLSGHDGVPDTGSSYHQRARLLLSQLFPTDRRLEEVTLPGSKRRGGRDLRADFFLPMRRLVVEAHGEQHYKFVLDWHKTPLGFIQAQQRDRDKEEWCELNGIGYVALPHWESDDEWSRRILREEADG